MKEMKWMALPVSLMLLAAGCFATLATGCSSDDKDAAAKEKKEKKEQQQAEEKMAEIYNGAYELYPTTNLWTFIKLDTRNGRMWLVQYSIESDEYRFEVPLNREPLASGNDQMAGRFALYPTENMWNFILLDRNDGRTWQVQWSQEPENQMIIPINFHAD